MITEIKNPREVYAITSTVAMVIAAVTRILVFMNNFYYFKHPWTILHSCLTALSKLKHDFKLFASLNTLRLCLCVSEHLQAKGQTLSVNKYEGVL